MTSIEGMDNFGCLKIINDLWPKYRTDQNGKIEKEEAKKMLINIACEN